MELSNQARQEFLEALWEHYARVGRGALPWRQPEGDGSFDPYKVMVSELMLQQTQVNRVIPKYTEFLQRFPTVQALSAAELGDVLRAWQGLGYNRRAKFLWQAAQQIDQLGQFPNTLQDLVKLSGIGVNTAGAILAYAFNQPAVFVETNIRTVYTHHFFEDRTDIAHSFAELQAAIADERLQGVLDELVTEGMIRCSGSSYSL
jgi:A/G-specific adenine glycosylase